MKVRLRISHPDEEAFTVEPAVGTTTIGRQETCDLVLDHPRVQRRHAQIELTADGTATITDLSRRSRSTVNDNPIGTDEPVTLAVGDEIGIAVYTLTVEAIEAPAETAVSAAEDPGAADIPLEREPLQLTITPPDEEADPWTYDLPRPWPEEGVLIGRKEECDLVLDHPRVQRQHAQLTRADGGLFVTDLSRRSRSTLNGNPLAVDQPARLALGDLLTMGPFSLTVTRVERPQEEEAPDPAVEAALEDELEQEGVRARQLSDEERVAQDRLRGSGGVSDNGGDGGANMPGYLRAAPPPPPDYTRERPPGLGRHSVRLINYLPHIYQTEFTSRFLALFESILLPMSWNIDNFDLYLDPRTTPRPFLDWLGQWFGVTFDDSWSEEQRRTLLQEANDIYMRRGTKWALTRLLEIYTGRVPEIIEEGQPAYTFTVKMPFRERDVNRPMIERLIEHNKPAHTSYQLVFDTRLDLDVMWSQLDF